MAEPTVDRVADRTWLWWRLGSDHGALDHVRQRQERALTPRAPHPQRHAGTAPHRAAPNQRPPGEEFARAVAALRSTPARREITVEALPAPQRLAPYAHAQAAAVEPAGAEEVASGRLILLYDPAGQEGWQGQFRVVCYVSAELESDLATDPLLPEVGWSWLTDALRTHAADHTALAGTVTQTTSTRFGELSGPPPTADVEIRASWTPVGPDLSRHAAAWYALLAATAGLPPPGVTALPDR